MCGPNSAIDAMSVYLVCYQTGLELCLDSYMPETMFWKANSEQNQSLLLDGEVQEWEDTDSGLAQMPENVPGMLQSQHKAC